MEEAEAEEEVQEPPEVLHPGAKPKPAPSKPKQLDHWQRPRSARREPSGRTPPPEEGRPHSERVRVVRKRPAVHYRIHSGERLPSPPAYEEPEDVDEHDEEAVEDATGVEAAYDDEIKMEFAGPAANAKPLASVVKTITGK